MKIKEKWQWGEGQEQEARLTSYALINIFSDFLELRKWVRLFLEVSTDKWRVFIHYKQKWVAVQ